MNLKEPIKFQTTFEKGILKLTDYSIFMLSRYEPSKVWVTVEPVKSHRSTNQNAYYWAVVIPLFCEKTGYAPAAMDRVFEQEFCPRKVLKWRGRDIITIKHCKDLSKGEFVEFLDKVIAEAGELGINIPSPNFEHQVK